MDSWKSSRGHISSTSQRSWSWFITSKANKLWPRKAARAAVKGVLKSCRSYRLHAHAHTHSVWLHRGPLADSLMPLSTSDVHVDSLTPVLTPSASPAGPFNLELLSTPIVLSTVALFVFARGERDICKKKRNRDAFTEGALQVVFPRWLLNGADGVERRVFKASQRGCTR